MPRVTIERKSLVNVPRNINPVAAPITPLTNGTEAHGEVQHVDPIMTSSAVLSVAPPIAELPHSWVRLPSGTTRSTESAHSIVDRKRTVEESWLEINTPSAVPMPMAKRTCVNPSDLIRQQNSAVEQTQLDLNVADGIIFLLMNQTKTNFGRDMEFVFVGAGRPS